MVLNSSQFVHSTSHSTSHSVSLDRSEAVSSITFEQYLSQEFEKLALIFVQAWKEDHPDAHLDSQEDVEACVQYVTTEMAIAGKAVGGVTGLALLSGAASKAARSACHCAFFHSSTVS
jgi:hypothetical protein